MRFFITISMYNIICSVNLKVAFLEDLFDRLRTLSMDAREETGTFWSNGNFSIDIYSVSEYFLLE